MIGQFLNQLNPLIAIVPAVLVGYWTYREARKKSVPEQWQSLYSEMKERAEKAEAKNIVLQQQLDDYHKKYGDLKGGTHG